MDEAKAKSEDWFEWYIDGRKRPIATEICFEGGGGLFVPGHYEIPCGGCDTLKSVDQAYDLVAQGVNKGYNVLYEGIMVMDDVNRAVALSKRRRLTVIGLTTPFETCLAAIRARRKARGTAKPLNPKNTRDRATRCARGLQRLERAGVEVIRMDREEAYEWCKKTLLR
jgi:hypothetical protein